jgi:Mn2+/Fe2+ NRAMP family transporter
MKRIIVLINERKEKEMKKLILFIMLATIPFLLGFFGIGMPELIVMSVILGILGLPILIIILVMNTKKGGVPAQSHAGKFCSNCGKEIAPSAYFCPGCGVKLNRVGK